MEDNKNTPTTIKEVGIHMTYMANEIHELKKLLKDQALLYVTKVELQAFISSKQADHDEIHKRLEGLEKWNEWAAKIVIGIVLSAVIALVVKSSGAL